MKKVVAIVTAYASFAELQAALIRQLFGDMIEIQCYSFDVSVIQEEIEADVVLFTLNSLHNAISKYIRKDAKAIQMTTTLSNYQYEQVACLPSGTKVMVVNYSDQMTLETVALFRQLGLDHLNFVPVYPGVLNIPQLNIAVTPGEKQCVPPFVDKIIDIGHRVIDATTIIDLAISLNLEHLLAGESFVKYFQSIQTNKRTLSVLYSKTNVLESHLTSLLNVMDDGIMVIGSDGTIHFHNKKAQDILECDNQMKDCLASQLFPQIPFKQPFNNSTEDTHRLIKINGQDISVKLCPVTTFGVTSGTLVILSRFHEKEKSQHKFRSQLLNKGHRAKYTFNDIITRDEPFLQIKELSLKKAASEASVLITGESGTGKELFAQATHNASKRRAGQFVAVNCAALPESLLESELFGYDEGAFTGAKKGGKIGLFELAHKGTLFLDEIGEMHLPLQARLLRVLEEREVMRIGGEDVIPVDIRLIAATNQNLLQLVEEGRFRKDLYYRLNVLPMTIPPLRKRKADILLLFEHIKQRFGGDFQLTPETERVLLQYDWPGNVRELRNCVEYITTLGKAIIAKADVMPILQNQDLAYSETSRTDTIFADFFSKITPEKDNYLFLLQRLYDYYQNKKRAGRRSLLQEAMDQDLFLTEAQIRKMLTLLKNEGLVILSSGRGGTILTQAGVRAYQTMLASQA